MFDQGSGCGSARELVVRNERAPVKRVHRARRFERRLLAARFDRCKQPRQHFKEITRAHRKRPVLCEPAGQFFPEAGNHVRHDRTGTQVAGIAERGAFADGTGVDQRDLEAFPLQPCGGADADDACADDGDLRGAQPRATRL